MNPLAADYSGIYSIRNLINGRIYIGSTTRSISERWREHKKQLKANRHHSILLQRSWNKYGAESFAFEVVEAVQNTDDLLFREQYWLDHTKSYDKSSGFNISPTAGNTAGRVVTEETRAKIAAAHLGRQHSYETKAKMAKIRTGYRLTEETKRKISASHLGISNGPLSAEHRAKISKGGKGIRRSIETRAKMSLAAFAREAAKRAGIGA